MSSGLGKKVCIIGAGGLGLVALKNLLETGFEVTVFERASYIGRLWHANTDPDQTSVLPQTRAVLSKYAVCPPCWVVKFSPL
jgi:dimethylaniline monooxygenase (N-oxide forming)